MTDPTPGGWPDAARPGYPKNPCVTGPHQITHASPDWPTKGPWVLLWCAEEELWTDLFGNREPPAAMAHHRYLGPCHTPAEVAAQVEAARRDEREAAAQKANSLTAGLTVTGRNYEAGYANGALDAARAIRARGDA